MTQITNYKFGRRKQTRKTKIVDPLSDYTEKELFNPHSLKLNEHCNLWGAAKCEQFVGLENEIFQALLQIKSQNRKDDGKCLETILSIWYQKFNSRFEKSRNHLKVVHLLDWRPPFFGRLCTIMEFFFWVLVKVIFGVFADFAYLKESIFRRAVRTRKKVLHFQFANWNLILVVQVHVLDVYK